MTLTRLARLREKINATGLDALLVTSLSNIRYLTGFTGSNAMLVVLPRKAYFLTDQRYRLQSKEQVRGASRIVARTGLIEALRERQLLPRRRVGFESDHLSYADHRQLRRQLPGVTFRPTNDLVEEIALRKDDSEITLISLAIRITEEVFRQVLSELRPGVRELEIAAEISYLHRRLGAEGDAFEPIVASGKRGALPHARASNRRLRVGDLVTLDFGCTVAGYCSDLTRTVAIGRASRRARRVYQAVLSAQEEAIACAHPGMLGRDLDLVARTRLAKEGFGRFFTHSLGHGIGLRIHERPRVAPRSRERLEAGSVITIEPGVYIPEELGVRIEDDLVLIDGGCRVLTSWPKELMIL